MHCSAFSVKGFLGGGVTSHLRQRRGVPQPGGSKFRAGVNQLLGNPGNRQVTFPAALRRNQLVQFQLPDGPQHRLHMTVRKTAFRGESLSHGDKGLVPKDSTQQLHLLPGKAQPRAEPQLML